MVTILAEGVPPGLGEPVFDKLDADLAKALMSIGSVKAVEIGAGRECAGLRGSEMNDPLLVRDGKIEFESNNAGGILGGISTGDAVVCRIAVKPTPSIARPQRTVDLASWRGAVIEIKGRHDPAIPPRIVPVAEAMVGSGAGGSPAAAEGGTPRSKMSIYTFSRTLSCLGSSKWAWTCGEFKPWIKKFLLNSSR